MLAFMAVLNTAWMQQHGESHRLTDHWPEAKAARAAMDCNGVGIDDAEQLRPGR